MRKMIEAIQRWRKDLTPRKTLGFSVFCDSFSYVVLCGNLIAAVLDFQKGRLWAGWASAVLCLLLCVVTIIRNYWWQRLLLAQQESRQINETLNALLEDENLRLKRIAVTASAVTNQVAHGFAVDLEPLKRSLADFCQKTSLSKMN